MDLKLIGICVSLFLISGYLFYSAKGLRGLINLAVVVLVAGAVFAVEMVFGQWIALAGFFSGVLVYVLVAKWRGNR